MNKNQDPAIVGKHSRSESGISRRELVRRLMIAGGAGCSLPAIAEARRIAGHLANHSAVAEAGAQTAKAVWSPVFLDRHQSETLEVLGERIIPGSSEAQANRFIDLLLSVDTQDAQTKFLASLSAFEAESLKRFSRPYKDSTETQQNEILAFASAAKPGETAEGQSQRVSIGDHFENIKRWVAEAYFSSEIGMKELGWTGNVFFTSFPGCPDSSGHRP
ncbi:MAG TPA: gluconate 2-dehydrogenase subunit 3 family protein [Terriglobia bacterium]|nr:gluconate 2-dehydrogenase subunit 3 family protein [Terriglobia bacterium]